VGFLTRDRHPGCGVWRNGTGSAAGNPSLVHHWLTGCERPGFNFTYGFVSRRTVKKIQNAAADTTQKKEDEIGKSRKWRWGVNRWWVLAFIILTVIATNRFAPVQQVIAVAPENLTKSPIITLPLVGGLYLTNTEVAMILMDLIILVIALVVKSRVKEYTLIAKGFTGALEMLIEVLYNLAQSTAGKWAKKIFPLFATILIVVLFANLLKLIPGFESIGFVEEVEHAGYTAVSLGGNWFNVTTPEVTEGGAVVVPFLRGLSTDLNFTLALALISVIMTQVIGVQAQGFGYFSKFSTCARFSLDPFLASWICSPVFWKRSPSSPRSFLLLSGCLEICLPEWY